MIQITTKLKVRHFAVFIFGLFACFLFCQNSCFAKVEPQGITEQQLDMFAANNIMFYNPGKCRLSARYRGFSWFILSVYVQKI